VRNLPAKDPSGVEPQIAAKSNQRLPQGAIASDEEFRVRMGRQNLWPSPNQEFDALLADQSPGEEDALG
jgi:hypothetical protein